MIAMREMEVKINMRYDFASIRIAIITKTDSDKRW